MSSSVAEQRERYADECFRRIRQRSSVLHCVVVDPNGYPVRSTMATRVETLEFVGLFGQLIARARGSLRKLQMLSDEAGGGGGGGAEGGLSAATASKCDDEELISLRVRSHTHEVLITLDRHHVFFVMQGQTEVDDGEDDGDDDADE